MSNIKLDSFKNLRRGKYDWKVQAKILTMWRGYSRLKGSFKSFNLLLVDNKVSFVFIFIYILKNCDKQLMLLLLMLQRGRIHAFVPGSVAESIERDIAVGKVFLIENFTVKDYEASDIFRPFAKEIQIVFDDQTRITQLDEEKVYIDQFVFDLYDLADLEPQSKQRKYLIGTSPNYIFIYCLFAADFTS